MRYGEAKRIREQLVNAGLRMTDNEALKAHICFDAWHVDRDYKVDERLIHKGQLYKVRQAHTSQTGWAPDAVPALYAVVHYTHEGTLEDPIPWVNGMESEEGKYYLEDEILYKATRDSGNPLYYAIKDLIGIYFEEVNE